MTLSQLDLLGYGKFLDDSKASFRIDTQNLPTRWDYIYQNQKMLLRLDQYGLDYAQAFPPSDVMMFYRDRYQQSSTWMTWFTSPQFKSGAFTNFFRPSVGVPNPTHVLDRFEAIFSPSHATYIIENEGLEITTKILLAQDEPTIVQSVAFKNLRDEVLTLSAMPALRQAMQWAGMDPWDKPEWYLRTAFCNDEEQRLGFSIYLMDPKCEIDNRRGGVFWANIEKATSAEVSYEKFVGHGTWENPASIFQNQLELALNDGDDWAIYNDKNNIFAYPPICSIRYDYELQPGEEQSIQQVFSWISLSEQGLLPEIDVARKSSVFLSPSAIESEIKGLDVAFNDYFSLRLLHTPDQALNQYVNEWLPLQLDWVCSLDRGHPSGMRGGRDSANDFTAMAPLNPEWTKSLIFTEFSCQRHDGWVPRHYSAMGHSGKERDTRGHVDAGAWALEMLYEYLAFTKDFAILYEQLPWLDEHASKTDTLLEHAIRVVEFFIDPNNIGEHGLVKLQEGEWLDTVNQAGLSGRGEGVMVTNQAIMCLTWLTEILEILAEQGKLSAEELQSRRERYTKAIMNFRDNLRKHAFNEEGYFNGFFNDDGFWLFSPHDPDGQKRVYGGANWWSVISGVAVPDLLDSTFKTLDFLKTDMGYHLNHPPFDKEPVPHVGRMASGDSPPGRSEHANPYNQGSHGFLGRALATAGEGDLLYEVFKSLLPYDQDLHPLSQTMTAPYGVLNVWENIPRFPNRGKNTFLTGSIAYAIRLAYDWMMGIRPMLKGLVIDPCIPAHFEKTSASFTYLGQQFELTIHNPNQRQAGVKELQLNGQPIRATRVDSFNQRTVFMISDDQVLQGINNIQVQL